jgi:hypothetical protein
VSRHNATFDAGSPAFAPLHFQWDARRGRFAHTADASRWRAYVLACGNWGCHAPHRGCGLAELSAAMDVCRRLPATVVEPLVRPTKHAADHPTVLQWRERIERARNDSVVPPILANCLLRAMERDARRVRAVREAAIKRGARFKFRL